MLGALLLAAVPAQAGPVEYRDVMSQTTGFGRSGRPSIDLRLRAFSQQQGKSSPQQPATVPGAGPQQQGAKSADADGPTAETAASSGESLTGIETVPQDQQPQTTVETIQLGEVDGTLCDCGEIKLPGAGFPLWPLLGLAAVPLLFISGDDEEDTPPNSPPPPPQVPEPATLLLFGSGLAALGASARRRRAQQAKLLAAREV